MCGIAGYSGLKDAKECILDCLSNLEYRGYDSCGIAFFDNKKINIVKDIGRVENLKKKIGNNNASSSCGIGHTRWATHGGVTSTNAHPHQSGHVTLIHNGIIENYHKLIDEYDLNNKLNSETDTEVAGAVLNILYESNNHDPLKSIRMLANKIEGTYAFLIMFDDKENEIYAVRHVSPLICAKSDEEAMLVSDITALVSYTKTYSIVPEDCIINIKNKDIYAYDIKNLKNIELKKETIDWDIDSAKKGGYEHYMLKEINDEPDAILNTIEPRLQNNMIDFSVDDIDKNFFENINKIHVVACGTALHSGRVAINAWEKLVGIPMEAYIASEYRYNEPLIDGNTLVIIISQSGETIDSLESLKLAKKNKAKIISIVNVKASSIARESDHVLYTHAGPEIAVASTKAYVSQIALLYIFFAWLSYIRGNVDDKFINKLVNGMRQLPDVIKDTLSLEKDIIKISESIMREDHCFYIGRGLDYISALEGALKLKEISYIHTEAYAAGELKHGTIALISNNVPVIVIDTINKISDKTLSNLREVKARGAKVTLVVSDDIKVDEDIADHIIRIRDIDEILRVFPVSIVTQLLAYHISERKGLDVDKPRNLAKSVTVE